MTLVAFFDRSTPGPSGPITAWAWQFGDGDTSTDQNPTHDYASGGNYTVVLEVTGSGSDGTSTASQPIVVPEPDAITAAFSESIASLGVTFSDLSTPGPSGPITGWLWHFGDGATSTSQNPSHTYATNGTYNVSLQVTGTSPDGTATTSSNVTVGSPSGAILFDGRATLMSELLLYETTPYNWTATWKDGTVHHYWRSQTPVMWDGLAFIKNNISLTADARYDQVYKCTAAIGDSLATLMPTFLAQTKGAAQLTKRHTISLGDIDYYAFAVKVNSWSGATSSVAYCDLASFGYQTAANDQFALDFAASGSPSGLDFRISSNAGYGYSTTGNPQGTTFYRTSIKPLVFGRWEEFVIGIKWSTHQTGFVTVWNRAPSVSGTWTKIADKQNIDTQFYGTSGYGTFPQDGDRGTLDKIGIYYGHYPTTATVETLYETGFVRCSSLAAAQATFPA